MRHYKYNAVSEVMSSDIYVEEKNYQVTLLHVVGSRTGCMVYPPKRTVLIY